MVRLAALRRCHDVGVQCFCRLSAGRGSLLSFLPVCISCTGTASFPPKGAYIYPPPPSLRVSSIPNLRRSRIYIPCSRPESLREPSRHCCRHSTRWVGQRLPPPPTGGGRRRPVIVSLHRRFCPPLITLLIVKVISLLEQFLSGQYLPDG